jgi:hypothetical protein
VIILIVSYNFNCPWNIQKKERVSHLLMERILLLTGTREFQKISSISFNEKKWIEEKLLENGFLQLDDKLAAIQFAEVLNKKTYSLVLEKDILLSMLTPGAGQSYFDNLILEIKNSIQNN